MQLLPLPDHVAIGGLEAAAARLADDAARTTAEAEELIRSLLRGDGAWRRRQLRGEEATPQVAGSA